MPPRVGANDVREALASNDRGVRTLRVQLWELERHLLGKRGEASVREQPLALSGDAGGSDGAVKSRRDVYVVELGGVLRRHA